MSVKNLKVAIKYIGSLVIYKIIDPHNYLLMTLDSKILKGLFKHERLNPAIIEISHGNIHKLTTVKTSDRYRYNSVIKTILVIKK